MSTEAIDVPRLLSRRKQKHVGARGVAEIIDLVVIAVASNVLIAVIGDVGEWANFPLLILYFTVWRPNRDKRSANV